MTNGKIIFFGTASVALPFLESLKKDFDIRMVITQPDSRGLRNRQVICPPAKSFAEKNQCRLEQPEKLKDQDLIQRIKKIQPDIGVVIAYGRLIPRSIFSIPRFGTVNVHFSLLPRYRGAAPVQRALENGEKETGITVFEINDRLDAGDIWSQKEFDILPDDTAGTLMLRLSREGAPFLSQTLFQILGKEIPKQPQDPSRATLAPAVCKEEGRADWNLTAFQLMNRQKAFTPWPGLFFYLGSRLIKIKKMTLGENTCSARGPAGNSPSGTILKLDETGLDVLCSGNTVLKISEFQPEGKKAMTPFCYSLGNPLPKILN